jgi:hypothetical protein
LGSFTSDEKTTGRSASYLEAAIQILSEAQQPMTTAEITAAALQHNLIVAQGRTPQKTMEARLYLAVRDDPTCPIQRIFSPGASGRAARNSVRWVLKLNTAQAAP